MTINLPLTFYGAYKGFKKEPYEAPVATSGIPRELPPQPWYTSPAVIHDLGIFRLVSSTSLVASSPSASSSWSSTSSYPPSGWATTTTSLASSSWSSSFLRCLLLRSLLSSPTLFFVPRTTTGGGTPSSLLVSAPSTFSSSPFTTSLQASRCLPSVLSSCVLGMFLTGGP